MLTVCDLQPHFLCTHRPASICIHTYLYVLPACFTYKVYFSSTDWYPFGCQDTRSSLPLFHKPTIPRVHDFCVLWATEYVLLLGFWAITNNAAVGMLGHSRCAEAPQ